MRFPDTAINCLYNAREPFVVDHAIQAPMPTYCNDAYNDASINPEVLHARDSFILYQPSVRHSGSIKLHRSLHLISLPSIIVLLLVLLVFLNLVAHPSKGQRVSFICLIFLVSNYL